MKEKPYSNVFRGIILFAVLCLLAPSAMAKKKDNSGRALFARQEYALAIPVYEDELKSRKITKLQTAQTQTQIGMCYYYLNKPREAVRWLRKGISGKFESADVYAILGLSLQKLEQYDEAIEAFQQCMKKNKKYPNLVLYLASCQYALDHPDPGANIKMRASKVNTAGSEYGISPVFNGEVFFSRAPTTGRDIDPRTGLGYSEIYSAKMDVNDLVQPKKEKDFNKMFYNIGVFAFDTTTSYMYMTSCDPKGKCGIYRCKYDSEKKSWGDAEPVFTNNQYDMAHPALANGGNTLYFTSNMSKGSQGRTDIWRVSRKGSTAKWSAPENLGKMINTSGREEFPFVEGDSILYFASTGQTGFGGLDVFAAAINKKGEFGKVINLGRPFNSGADDFNLVISGNKGLMVSSRNPSQSDNIFVFAKSDIPSPYPAPKLEEPKPAKTDTAKAVAAVDTVKPEPKQALRPHAVIATIYFDFDKFIPSQDYNFDDIVAMMKSYPNASFEVAGHTDHFGGPDFNEDLSLKRAEYVARRLARSGFPLSRLAIKAYGLSHPAVKHGNTPEELAKNRRVEIIILK